MHYSMAMYSFCDTAGRDIFIIMKLSHWAKANGLSCKAAWRMFHAGKLPVPAQQLATGTIIVQGASYTQARNLTLSLRPDDRRTLTTVLQTLDRRSTARRNTSP